MKTIMFSNDITDETISELINEIEVIESHEQGVETESGIVQFGRKIYFNSAGGDVASAAVLIDYINNNRRFIFNLVAYWQISSSAFNVFTMVNCEKRILEHSFAIVHLMNREISTREITKSKSLDKFLISEMDSSNDKLIDWYTKIGINDDQIEEIKNGEDVTISYEQLASIMERCEFIHNESKKQTIPLIKPKKPNKRRICEDSRQD